MKFLLLLSFLIPINSFADWSLVHQDDADHYIDYKLMSKSGHKTRAWYLQNYAEPQTIKIFNTTLLKIDQNLIARLEK